MSTIEDVEAIYGAERLVAYGFEVNPQPWAIGPISIGWGKEGKRIPKVAPEATLQAYQKSIQEQLVVDGCTMKLGNYSLRFWFSRQLEEYVKSSTGGTGHRNHADGTNMMKGTEDALQGVLIGDDRDVIRGEWIMAGPQTSETVPWVVVECRYGLEDYNLDASGWPNRLTDQGLDAYTVMRKRQIAMENLSGVEWEP